MYPNRDTNSTSGYRFMAHFSVVFFRGCLESQGRYDRQCGCREIIHAMSSVTAKSYTTSLTEAQAELMETLLPPAKPGGRPRTVDILAVLNAILYVLGTGCQWRNLPGDFPPAGTVYYYFRQWRDDGSWQGIHDRLRTWVRVMEGRHPSASAGIIDSQSVKTASYISRDVGFDAGKLVKGRKRFTLVDTFGLLIAIQVVAASVQERKGAQQLFTKVKASSSKGERLIRIFADGGFRGQDFCRMIMDIFGLILEIVLRPQDAQGFHILPKRWVVERTFAWFNHWRRLSKEYELLPQSTEAFIYIGMIRLMLRRLA